MLTTVGNRFNFWGIALVMLSLCSVGCTDTQTGAAAGALLGGGLGALVDSHHHGRGALIGAALGGMGGALLGGQSDKEKLERENEALRRDCGDTAHDGCREKTIVVQHPPKKVVVVPEAPELRRFRIADRNRDNRLDLSEFRTLVPHRDARRTFSYHDRNRDGFISFSEFKSMERSTRRR